MGESAHSQKSEVILGVIPQKKRHQSTKYLCDVSRQPLTHQPREESVKTGHHLILAAAAQQTSTLSRATQSSTLGLTVSVSSLLLWKQNEKGPGHALVSKSS